MNALELTDGRVVYGLTGYEAVRLWRYLIENRLIEGCSLKSLRRNVLMAARLLLPPHYKRCGECGIGEVRVRETEPLGYDIYF